MAVVARCEPTAECVEVDERDAVEAASTERAEQLRGERGPVGRPTRKRSIVPGSRSKERVPYAGRRQATLGP